MTKGVSIDIFVLITYFCLTTAVIQENVACIVKQRCGGVAIESTCSEMPKENKRYLIFYTFRTKELPSITKRMSQSAHTCAWEHKPLSRNPTTLV